MAGKPEHCVRCASPMSPNATWCVFCEEPRARGMDAALSGDAERRQLSVLFADMVDSTRLSTRLDAEDLRDILARYHNACERVVRRLGGHVAQYLGDGVLVYFGYPQAHEDDARRAVVAGRAIVEAIAEISERTERLHNVRLAVRVGIHSGAVVIGEVGGRDHRERLAVGHTPNLAAKLQMRAQPNSVVVSDATRKLCEGYFEFVPLPADGSGVASYEATAESGARGRLEVAQARGLTPLVDRTREGQQLLEHWERARQGHATAVLLTGEAGIGKSRLVRELSEIARSARQTRLESFCYEHEQARALRPVSELLSVQLGLPSLPETERLERLARWALASDTRPEDSVPLLAALLLLPTGDRFPPLDPTAGRQRAASLQAIANWTQRLARQQPVLWVTEDLHWADATTLELLGKLVSEIRGVPLLTLLVSRSVPSVAWASKPAVHRIHIERLEPRFASALVGAVTRKQRLPQALVDRISDRGDGNPLFLEEITKAVVELRSLDPVQEPRDRADADSRVVIPESVQDSLMARLDRLGRGRRLLQLAATLGRSFRFDVLQAVLGDYPGLREELERLVDAEFIVADSSGDGYTFKHALICDAAYASLLRKDRLRCHEIVVRTLERDFAALAETQPDLLARHYSGANLVPEAIDAWIRAGMRASAVAAFSEASSAFASALEEQRKLPPSDARDRAEIELRVAYGLTLFQVMGYADKLVENNYVRARELCERFGDVPLRVLYGVWAFHVVRGDRDATASLARILERECDSQDPGARMIAHSCLGTRAFLAADHAGVREHMSVARQGCDRRGPGAQMVQLMHEYGYDGLLYPVLFQAWSEALQAHAERAQSGFEEALELAERAELPYLRAMALAFGAAIARELGRPQELSERAAELLRIAVAHRLPYWLAIGQCVSGVAALASKRPDAAVEPIQTGLAMLQGIGAESVRGYYMAYLVEAQLALGKLDDALASAESGLALTASNLGVFGEPDLLRLQGLAQLQRGERAQAERSLRAAVRVAAEHGSTLLELRSLEALARLLRDDGRDDAARASIEACCARLDGTHDATLTAPLLQLRAELA